MNPVKNFDWKHYAAYAACIVILGVEHGVAAVAPYATLINQVGMPLFLYAGISLAQGGVFAAGAKKDGAS